MKILYKYLISMPAIVIFNLFKKLLHFIFMLGLGLGGIFVVLVLWVLAIKAIAHFSTGWAIFFVFASIISFLVWVNKDNSYSGSLNSKSNFQQMIEKDNKQREERRKQENEYGATHDGFGRPNNNLAH
ncbi:MAG: hypothetical protein RBR32_03410 [Bacteroidales bacterium]|nr:hypothetical protein [Bacteroidales bacterium]